MSIVSLVKRSNKEIAKYWNKYVNKYDVKIWESALESLEKYISTSKVAINENIALNYARCLIGVGKRDKALNVLALIKENFFGVTTCDSSEENGEEFERKIEYNISSKYKIGVQIRLANLYAMCSSEKEVRAIIDSLEQNTALTVEFYDEIAQNCSRSGLLDLALELYEKCLEKNPIQQLKEKILKRQDQIRLYQQYPLEFRECSYGHFIAEGHTLAPGYIITAEHVCKKNNIWENNCKLQEKRTLMIWKIEGNFVYAFPLSLTLDKGQYVFTKEKYPAKGIDRRLKDSVYVIEKKHIRNVCGKITDEDYQKAIETMYVCTCHTQKGNWEAGSDNFMKEMLKTRRAFIGNIIMTYDTKAHRPHYYLVTGVDLELHEYETVEVDHHFKPLKSKDSKVMFSDDSKEIKAIFPMKDSSAYDFWLKELKVISNDGSALGVVFLYNGIKLEIMRETEKYYMCMDVTESKYPQEIKIFAIPKTESLNIISKVSERDFNIQVGKYNKKTEYVRTTISNNKLRSTPLFKGKARRLIRQ